MAENKLEQLHEVGQSVWLDFISRSFIDEGGLQDYVDQGLRGVTSNPSIFEEAISEGEEYDQDLARLASEGLSVQAVYENLAVKDIQEACEILQPVYEESRGADGFVSLEANPHLAHNTAGTILEVQRLWEMVDRENLMIKVPATPEGIPAVEVLTAQGYNINITLMFSLEQYEQVAEAYLSGLEQFAAQGGDPSTVSSVASFFVSRIDVKVDRMLDALRDLEAEELKGRIGIASAKMAYQRYLKKFSTVRWDRLADQGARVQRVLYGSTSTKDPAYSDTLYPDNLIGKDTVNTLPPETLEAFLDHGTVSASLTKDVGQAEMDLSLLTALGIDLHHVTLELLDEGVIKFANSYDELMSSIAEEIED